MRFREILSRLNGIDTPIGGISWEPPTAEVTIAANLVRHLEDRRVLFSPSDLEVPEHCIQSVLEIRHLLTSTLTQLSQDDDDLAPHVRAMRAACRKFLDAVHHVDVGGGWWHQSYAGWVFLAALGEMRGVFGVHLAQIAAKFRLDVEDGLASILPAADV